MKRTYAPVRILLFCLLLLAVALPAAAQFRAGIQGTVTDTTGAVVSNAKIVATNQSTGVAKSTVTTNSGFYRLDFLPPGIYTVTITAGSFKPATRKDVNVGGDAVSSVDMTLQLPTATQSVTVSGSENGLQTENANIQQTITERQITSLPAFGRDPYELIRMAPGVFGDASRSANGNAVFLPNGTGPGGSNSSIFQTENQVQISGNGQRVSANNYQIDGVSVNSLQWGGAAVVTPNMESVKEMNVTTNSYSAEDGRNSGVQVKVVSQSGSNKFHGSALFKYDDPNFNAYPSYGGYNNAKPERVQNNYRDYAGSLGGPIIKDKLFFFFSYEGQHQTNTSYTTGYYMLPQYFQALAASRANTAILQALSSKGMSPRIVNTLPATCTNFTNQGRQCQVVNGGLDIGSITGTYGNYVSLNTPQGGGLDGIPDVGYAQFALPSRSVGNQYNGRIDYNMGNTQFAASTYITKLDNLGADGSANGMPAADVNMKPLNMLFTVLGNTTISPTLLNEARFNFSRYAFNQVTSNAGLVNWGIPRMQIEGMPTGNMEFGANWSENTPGIFAQNQYEFRDIVSKIVGNQAWKFGFEIRKEQDNNNAMGGARPLYSFSGPWNLANGTPIYEQINLNPISGLGASGQEYFRTTNIAWFVQNDWQVRPNLTINLGLRWEYFSPLSSANGQMANLVVPPGPNGLLNATMKIGGDLYHKDLNNFAPRIGFAWTPYASNNKVVVRGGFGVAYNRLPDAVYGNVHGNPPFFARYGLCCGTSSADWGTPYANGLIQFALGSSNSPLSYPANLAVAQGNNPQTGFPNAGAVEVWGASPDTATPYVYNYSLGIEQQLPYKFVLGLGYEGSSAHKLLRILPAKFVIPQTPTQVPNNFSAVYMPRTDVTSNFNALDVNLTRSSSKGLLFMVKYRWSKSLDELSNEGPGFSTNQTYPFNQAYEYGPSDYDSPQYFMTSLVYQVPFFRGRTDLMGMVLGGWEVSGIFTFHSGFPWTPVTYAQCLNLPSSQCFGPIRPVGYYGGAGNSSDTSTFTANNGNFPGGGLKYFDNTKPGVPGVGRNSFRGPRYGDLDMTLGKSIPLQAAGLGEHALLDLRMNVFNVTNHLNLLPFGFGSAATTVENSNFGMSSGAMAGRVVELQARFSF